MSLSPELTPNPELWCAGSVVHLHSLEGSQLRLVLMSYRATTRPPGEVARLPSWGVKPRGSRMLWDGAGLVCAPAPILREGKCPCCMTCLTPS